MNDYLTFAICLVVIGICFFAWYVAAQGATEWSRNRVARYRELGGWACCSKKGTRK